MHIIQQRQCANAWSLSNKDIALQLVQFHHCKFEFSFYFYFIHLFFFHFAFFKLVKWQWNRAPRENKIGGSQTRAFFFPSLNSLGVGAHPAFRWCSQRVLITLTTLLHCLAEGAARSLTERASHSKSLDVEAFTWQDSYCESLHITNLLLQEPLHNKTLAASAFT